MRTVENTGVTPEELLRDFRALVDAQSKSLRGLAIASKVSVETIRGWKDMGRFPRNTHDFTEVVRVCLRSLKPEAPYPPWRIAEWEVRYQEAKRIWENREIEYRPVKQIPNAHGGQSSSSSVQVYGGDYVNGIKNSVHIGDVNHHPCS